MSLQLQSGFSTWNAAAASHEIERDDEPSTETERFEQPSTCGCGLTRVKANLHHRPCAARRCRRAAVGSHGRLLPQHALDDGRERVALEDRHVPQAALRRDLRTNPSGSALKMVTPSGPKDDAL